MYDLLQHSWVLDDDMKRLQDEKKSAIELQKRRHEDWNDNYELYRNKVKTNRLTQRQAVNIPLMKETVKTLLSRIDDPPEIEWKNLENDEVKELIFQEIWNQQYKDNKLELVDVLDKKNVLLYGLSCKKLNLSDNGISVSVLDIYDVALDPLTSPWDLESSRFVIHQNIFKTVQQILADPKYTKEGKDELKMWADSPAGILQSQDNKDNWEDKMERLKSMGIDHKDFALFAGGDRLVNLTEHFTKVWNSKKKEFEKRVIIYADDTIKLYDESLMDCLGVDFWPFVVWSEDPETNDVYPDSVADLVRTPNKVLNVWFSQLIENRTLKNFQMHWFLPGEGYSPQTYTPGPGVMLPAPPGEDINKVIKPVEVSGLDDTLTAIQQVTMIVERGTGATAIEKGQAEKGTQTLGEVQILVGKANERTLAMAKFYRMAWYELAKKWADLLQANAPKSLDLYKTARSGKLYKKKVLRGEWKSSYEPTVRSSSEQETESMKSMQKWMFILSQNPNNPVLRKIAQKRQLDLVDITPEEMKQIEDGQDKQDEMALMQQQMAMQQGQPQGQGQPPQAQGPVKVPAQSQEDLTPQLQELSQLIGA